MSDAVRPGLSIGALVALVLCLGLLCLLLWLGFWQLERAKYKESLSASFQRTASATPAPPAVLLDSGAESRWRHRPVRVVGAPLSARQFLLDNRTHGGRAGYHVLTVVLQDGKGVIVNRGWVPLGPDRSRLPEIPIADTRAQFDGRLVPPPRSGLVLGDTGYGATGWPKVVQRVELETIAAQLEIPLLSAMVLLDPGHPGCFVCEWSPVTGISAERHRGYAVQWFALATTLLVMLAVFAMRRSPQRG